MGQGITQARPSLSIDEARSRIGSEVLGMLADKFNGSLTEVRSIDDKDHLL